LNTLDKVTQSDAEISQILNDGIMKIDEMNIMNKMNQNQSEINPVQSRVNKDVLKYVYV